MKIPITEELSVYWQYKPYLKSSIRKLVTMLLVLGILFSLIFLSLDYRRAISKCVETETKTASQMEEGKVEILIKHGDSLTSILHEVRANIREIHQVAELAKGVTILPGQKLIISFIQNSSKKSIDNIRIFTDYNKLTEISRVDVDASYSIKELLLPVKQEIVRFNAGIVDTLANTLRKLQIPHSKARNLINAYATQVDFHKNIKKDDSIELLVEKYVNDETGNSRYGNIIFARLHANKKVYELYYFSHDGQKHQYFTEQGISICSGMLRNPLNNCRVTSKFGKRLHPIYGAYTMHHGVDFAAPHGTPIYATADGFVENVGWQRGYGNFVKIKHNKSLATFYAHISKFAKKVSARARVNRGDIIAYVGNTGYATAPHLHYEVRINSKPTDPLKIKTVPVTKLTAPELQRFNLLKISVREQLAGIARTPAASV